MGKKKKKVSVNTIDKYIKQIKYRAESKQLEKTKIRQPRIVISRIRSRRLQDFIDPTIPDKNENNTFNIKVPVAKIPRKRKKEVSKHDAPVSLETVCNPVSSDLSLEKKKNGTLETDDSVSSSNQWGKTSNDLRKSQDKKIKRILPSDIETVEKEFAEKLKQTSRAGKNVKRSTKKPCSRTGSIIKANIVRKKSSTKVKNATTNSRLSSASLENNENVFVAADEPISKTQTIQTENQEDISSTKESSEANPVSNEPCLCEPSNFGIDEPNAITRESLIPSKYRSCVEELKSLTAESITKFIMDNQQYYIDFRNAAHVRKVITNGKKRQKNESKDSFKCNPFDSSQQVAMYLALREIFHVPAGSFLECRYFFTLLIPEICCQLFAQIFKIKTSFAPRLIKKFYSKPVCPI